MKLSELKPAPRSKKGSRRVGRGESSGAGKTSGRGGKGQTARTGGKIRPGFEGGQMPLYRRIPKLGFRSRQATLGINRYAVINLSDLERFQAGTIVTRDVLLSAGINLASKNKAGIKVLGKGELTKKLEVHVDAISDSAKTKIESLGGSVHLIGATNS